MSCSTLSTFASAAARPRTAAAAVAARGEMRACAGVTRRVDSAAAPRRFPSSVCPPVALALRGKNLHSHAVRGLPSTTAAPLHVTCMANPRRVSKVSQQMRREISNMLQTDKNIRSMISPEERMGVDNVVSVMVTVADVEISNDLQVVKVFVSILGDERGKKNAINGLKKLEGYVRRNIGKKVSLRLTPEIRFVYDDSFERGQRVATLLDDLRVKREVRVANGGKYTKSELLAVEDTISNPYDDEDDGDRWTAADATDGDDDDDEGADAEGGDEDDVDIQQVWDKMQKDAEAARGEDDLINVQ
mmetsp:Transcript_34211/g.54823  ORF Transcript_34211/g.54823 Transcript_34211/m.54823 type:complete len:303 (+) Transcript_34211:99-1007(+)